MAEELRHFYSDEYVRLVAGVLASEVEMSASDFVDYSLSNGWCDLALKQRMARLTAALVKFLPDDYAKSIAILTKIFPKISGGACKYGDMLAMFVPDYTVEKGLCHIDISLDALEFFTSNGTTSELAIRPFILKYQTKTMQRMLLWSKHSHHHVRRLASEGCRPRLPWSMSLPEFKKDPSLIMPILHNLKNDDSKFVQKSVANNLNDIAKDNPQIVLDFTIANINQHKNTDWILKRACRTLLKQGNESALTLFGSPKIEVKNANLELESPECKMGGAMLFKFSADILGALPDNLRLEYAVDFMKSNGSQNRKIFKISETAPKSPQIKFDKKHKFIELSTRKHYCGEHNLAIIVNGKEVASQKFMLL